MRSLHVARLFWKPNPSSGACVSRVTDHGPSGTKHLDRDFAVLSPVMDFISLPS